MFFGDFGQLFIQTGTQDDTFTLEKKRLKTSKRSSYDSPFMSFINARDKEINCKIAYFGPAFSGKTTTLRHIYEKTSPGHRGKITTLSGAEDKTLFFDFLPLTLGKVKGYDVRLHLYTVPGQVVYDSSRTIILKGVD